MARSVVPLEVAIHGLSSSRFEIIEGKLISIAAAKGRLFRAPPIRIEQQCVFHRHCESHGPKLLGFLINEGSLLLPRGEHFYLQYIIIVKRPTVNPTFAGNRRQKGRKQQL